MNTYEGKMIGEFPADWTEEHKEAYLEILEMRTRDLNSLCVIYHPNCGCEVKIDFVLDRYPMSPKIISRCGSCKKVCLAEIREPITFYLNLTNTEYSLEDLKKMHITESRQKHLIEKYRDMAP